MEEFKAAFKADIFGSLTAEIRVDNLRILCGD
jgi:hypothetical protein